MQKIEYHNNHKEIEVLIIIVKILLLKLNWLINTNNNHIFWKMSDDEKKDNGDYEEKVKNY
jgi:hypothetical protein